MNRRKRTSELLYDEYPLLVPPSLATLIGLNEAIVVQQIHYWLGRSAHHYDGRVWCYNTYDQWHEQFPFWGVSTIRRIFNGLEKSGLLISTAQYNDHPADRTKWYTIDYGVLDSITGGESDPPSNLTDHVLKMSSPSAQDDQMESSKVSDSSTRQRTTKDYGPQSQKSGEKRPDEPSKRQTPLDPKDRDPILDRTAILRDQFNRPELSPRMNEATQIATLELQRDWDRRWKKR